MEPCGSGMDILSLIESIARCTGAGVQIVLAVSVLELLSASLAKTFNFISLNVSNISLRNGMPSSFGQSHRSRRLCSSICLRVTVSGSHQCGAVVAVTGFWYDVAVSIAQIEAVRVDLAVVSRRSRARCFFAAFFQILSMTTKNGMCSTFANRDGVRMVDGRTINGGCYCRWRQTGKQTGRLDAS